MKKTAPGRDITASEPISARLVVYPIDGPAQSVLLEGASLTIGRGDECDLQLLDPRASNNHAKLRRRKASKTWEIKDLGSSNGTFVDGELSATSILGDQAVVRIGDSLLILELGPFAPSFADPGRSLATTLLDAEADTVARGNLPVLILGPTGAGKGHLAKRIAQESERGGRFVHVNCAALPHDLVESELFGHARGAFTGANREKKGLIESAHEGTLFLDEIGSLAPALQAKLLVCVEEGTIRRVGATESRSVDVRFVAATNMDVHQAISDGSFRKDLYFRLSGRSLTVQPLRRRLVDVIPLVVEMSGTNDHRAFTTESLEALRHHDWPGNVRELVNLAKALPDAPEGPIDYHPLPQQMTAFLKQRASHRKPAAESSTAPPRRELVRLMADVEGNVSEAARRLGKHRNQVVRWLEAYGIRKG